MDTAGFNVGNVNVTVFEGQGVSSWFLFSPPPFLSLGFHKSSELGWVARTSVLECSYPVVLANE